ncbi:hypothetical protein [Pseudothermotoga sp.]
MRGMLVFITAVMVVLFSSCSAILPTGSKPEDLAKGLADKIMELIRSEPTDDVFFELIYVPSEDRSNLEVQYQVVSLFLLSGLMFVNPSTPTSISVAGVNKIETKLMPWITDGKPAFVKDVYSVTYMCTRNASTTVVNFPMITVENENKGYFFTVYVKETGGGTQVAWYPGPLIVGP